VRGRLEADRLRSRLDGIFARVDEIEDLEARAHFARYLCVLVSGYVERCCVALAIEWCRKQSSPGVQRYVNAQLDRFQNPGRQRIIDFVTAFDPQWGKLADGFIVEARAAALESIVARRHQIAHGDEAGISYAQVQQYYVAIAEVMGFLEGLFDPAPAP